MSTHIHHLQLIILNCLSSLMLTSSFLSNIRNILHYFRNYYNLFNKVHIRRLPYPIYSLFYIISKSKENLANIYHNLMYNFCIHMIRQIVVLDIILIYTGLADDKIYLGPWRIQVCI